MELQRGAMAMMDEIEAQAIEADRDAARRMLDEVDGLLNEAAIAAETVRCLSHPTPELLAETAREIAADMRPRLSQWGAWHEEIWAASEALRRALAAGELAAYGWRGEREPKWDNEPWPICRERVPPELLRAPVTLTQTGVVPFPRHHDYPVQYRLLFCGILIDAGELLRIWPAPHSLADAPRIPAKDRKPGRANFTGRPPHKGRDTFIRELVRLALDPDGLPPRPELFRRMIAWCDAELGDDAPGETTIRDWLAAWCPE
ncbi:hypothetical protein [Roseicella aerolata]|uniref:Uncharacterized protein n=1 Tax=Roseicella aerolata TaxID=2883479 RepID=A0A9X1IBE2_9PROT|nr:hypothetical protein [Roseicella aerolata]MCB4820754.1 hypothetical protein [Roseicella aerolata]